MARMVAALGASVAALVVAAALTGVNTPYTSSDHGNATASGIVLKSSESAPRDALAGAIGNTIRTLDTAGWVGFFTSLELDISGNPVVSYHDDTNGDLKLLHCNDPSCTGDDESITSPVTSGNVGEYTSLELDAVGNPVVSFYGFGTERALALLHCNDPNCSGGDESVTAPDAPGVGQHTSLALDGAGDPVVSYFDETNADLKVLHCNDPDCSGADESIIAVDTAGEVGLFTSLALDATGNPVVSYWDNTNRDLKVLHCNDELCAGGDESIAAPDTAGSVGLDTSLVLDAAGNPVVSYNDETNGDLKVLHCNDPNCSGGGDAITAPDQTSWARRTSLSLDGAGFPVVSYFDVNGGDLRVIHCNDPNCADGGEAKSSPDTNGTVGQHSSLALDGAGFPVVSYQAGSLDYDLKLLHCGDPTCNPDSDGDGCSDAQEQANQPALGGMRNPKLFWDFFDTPGATGARDRIISTGDIQRIVLRFGTNSLPPLPKEQALAEALTIPPASGYHTAFDRSPPTGDPWDLGPPDGSIATNDIVFEVNQFGHTCA